MTYDRTSFAVAGGTGLQVPTTPRPIRQRDWTSTAPEFLRRPVEELAALDRHDPSKDKRPTKTRNRKTATNQPERYRSPEERAAGKGRRPGAKGPDLDIAAITADYLAPGGSLHGTARKHGTSADRLKRVLVDAGVPVRAQGKRTTHNPKPPAVVDVAQIVNAYQAGASLRDLERQWKTDRARVGRILRENGVELRPRGGAREGRAA